MKTIEKLQLYYTCFYTPLGFMCAIASKKTLYFLQFFDNKEKLYQDIQNFGKKLNATIQEGSTEIIDLTIKELEDYFLGDLEEFTVPIALYGTQFQTDVWLALAEIPFGYLTCYTKFTEDVLRNKKSTRAVATAIGKNNILIIIPCHRVTTTAYRLVPNEKNRGGYKGGPRRKELLIMHENEKVRKKQEKKFQLPHGTEKNPEYFA